MQDSCHVCGGDCAGANPPVINCPFYVPPGQLTFTNGSTVDFAASEVFESKTDYLDRSKKHAIRLAQETLHVTGNLTVHFMDPWLYLFFEDRAAWWLAHSDPCDTWEHAHHRPAEPEGEANVWYRGWEVGYQRESALWTGRGWQCYKGGVDLGAPNVDGVTYADALDAIDEAEDE